MATVSILEQDRVDAENVLEQFLRDKAPGDYSKGTALHDLAVTAFSNIFAYLRQDNDNTRKRQSLLLLANDSGTDVDDMVDEILSNFFLTRKTGRKSRGVITIYFNTLPGETEALVIQATTLFFRTTTLAFKPDSDVNLTYTAKDMFAVTRTSGTTGVYTPVVEYGLRVPVIAVDSGVSYDIVPGSFISWQFRNPYVTRVENTTKFSGGGDKESTAQMLERAPTAISVRDLNSARSIDAVLREEFPEIDEVFVTGMGDPEMRRDLVTEDAAHLYLHVGACTDIYLRCPLVEAEYTAVVGGLATDPRSAYCVLRDANIADFVATGVVRGDVIQMYNNLESEPDQYIVHDVAPYGVIVSSRSPFPRVLPKVQYSYSTDASVGPTATGGTDRILSQAKYTFTTADVGKYVSLPSGVFQITSVNTTPNYVVVQEGTGVSPVFTNATNLNWELLTDVVDYSIGHTSQDDVVARRFGGRFTKDIQHSGFVVLPSLPIYRISDVYITSTDPDLSVDGRITFARRLNGDAVPAPLNPTPPPTYDPALLSYRVWSRNPTETQSGWQVMELQVGWDTNMSRFDGETLHVVFDTLSGYESIWAFVTGVNRRLTCASTLPRGLNPVYVAMDIKYKLSEKAATGLDTDAAATALAEYITQHETLLTLDTSDVVAFLRKTYDVIGSIAPLTISYNLYAPDGRVIHYQTLDEVRIDADKYHPTYAGSAENRLDDPLLYGVSDRTLRLVSVPDLITFTVQS